MGVSLHTRTRSFEIGAASFFTSWFSTIYVRLENESWGVRFPAIMNDLYAGKLPADRVTDAFRELETIREEMSRFAPDAVVWDYEDRTKQAPWGTDVSPHVASLAEEFITSDGKDLFEVLRNAFDEALQSRSAVTVR